MEEIVVKVVTEQGVELPAYETAGAAGMDVCAYLKNDLILQPLQRVLVPTGIRMEMPKKYECQVRPRSGLALNHGITVLNTPGTIDADSRAEIGIVLINLSDKPFTIQNGDRIAQLVFKKCERARWEIVQKLDSTKREDGSFGDSGL